MPLKFRTTGGTFNKNFASEDFRESKYFIDEELNMTHTHLNNQYKDLPRTKLFPKLINTHHTNYRPILNQKLKKPNKIKKQFSNHMMRYSNILDKY